ncbi:imm11 family protein [Litorisediminicola beolgyonensis]|uniref:Imm11 family protein n=1 Tax=Litorisediminicola beolgyonensis TaxID=1173614 RepID=A0ABW3ZLM8_9RHOB
MVWALIDPGQFGTYFIDGDYPGWADRLRVYYETAMSDAEKRAMGMEDRLLLSEFAAKFTKDRGRLAEHERPATFVSQSPLHSLGAMVKLTDRLLAVDDRLAEIIERHEPGRHQFWPIDIRFHGGATPDRPYFGFVIGIFLETFDPDRSDPGAWRARGPRYSAITTTTPHVSKLALSSEAMGDAHIWRETRLSRPEICLSDVLHAAIAEAGLAVPKTIQMREV